MMPTKWGSPILQKSLSSKLDFVTKPSTHQMRHGLSKSKVTLCIYILTLQNCHTSVVCGNIEASCSLLGHLHVFT